MNSLKDIHDKLVIYLNNKYGHFLIFREIIEDYPSKKLEVDMICEKCNYCFYVDVMAEEPYSKYIINSEFENTYYGFGLVENNKAIENTALTCTEAMIKQIIE